MSDNPLSTVDAVWTLEGCIDESDPVHLVVKGFPFRIGRASDLALRLRCSSVSKLHAEIVERNGRLWITDLGSTNGTFVNGVRVTETESINYGDVLQFGKIVFHVSQELTEEKTVTLPADAGDNALALLQFDTLMTTRAVVPFFQPIVELQQGQTVGHELLTQSRVFGLKDPRAMFHAAAHFNRVGELSRLMRSEGVQVSMTLPSVPNLFLNVHPIELAESGLVESLEEIRAAKPTQCLTLEIHDTAVTDAAKMQRLRGSLNDLDIKLAYDDFGAGQARLIELAKVPPDYLKVNLSLVRNISTASAHHQQLVETLVRLAKKLDIATVAVGVETPEDGETCRQLGFELAQGYYYGRPATAESFTSLR